jgi:hypothetical protein
MNHLQVGDEVSLTGLPNSEWRDSHGCVVDVTEYTGSTGEKVQECCVLFRDQRRWFLATNLIRTISPRYLRFFRAEAADRWKLDPEGAAFVNGTREELVDLLVSRYGFATRRALVEVDDFLNEFRARMGRAVDVSPVVTAVSEPFRAAKSAACAAGTYSGIKRGAA